MMAGGPVPTPQAQASWLARNKLLVIIAAVMGAVVLLGCCTCSGLLGALVSLTPQTEGQVAVEPPTTTATETVPSVPETGAVVPTSTPNQAEPADSRVTYAVVARVIDGDTVELKGGKRVRYIGMDTPESAEPYGSSAAIRNRALVEGKKVKLVKDVSETDKYGRLLRYVYLGGVFVNERLVLEGLATVLTIPPDVAHSEDFLAAQKVARTAERGIWTPPPPPPAKPKPEPEPAPQPSATFYGSAKSDVYHYGSCYYVDRIKPENLVTFSGSADARSSGYRPCKVCSPP